MRLAITALIASLIIPLAGTAALANLPDPLNCTWDDCLGRSPKNATAGAPQQYVFMGTLRNTAGDPIEGYPAANVELVINAPCANPATLNPSGPSNANGDIIWDAATLNQGGGACEGPAVVEILVDGLVFNTLDDVRSPDIDGDTFVALADLVDWQGAFVAQTPLYVGDLSCDGFIALSDLVVWQAHFTAP